MAKHQNRREKKRKAVVATVVAEEAKPKDETEIELENLLFPDSNKDLDFDEMVKDLESEGDADHDLAYNELTGIVDGNTSNNEVSR